MEPQPSQPLGPPQWSPRRDDAEGTTNWLADSCHAKKDRHSEVESTVFREVFPEVWIFGLFEKSLRNKLFGSRYESLSPANFSASIDDGRISPPHHQRRVSPEIRPILR